MSFKVASPICMPSCGIIFVSIRGAKLVVLGCAAELKLVKSQQVRAMAKLAVQKAKAEKQLAAVRAQLKRLDECASGLMCIQLIRQGSADPNAVVL